MAKEGRDEKGRLCKCGITLMSFKTLKCVSCGKETKPIKVDWVKWKKYGST